MTKCLIIYPNLHMMLVPSVAVGLFTEICDKEGVEVEIFDTTNYEDPSTEDSAVRRVQSLQYREFDPENDLGFVAYPSEQLYQDLDKLVEKFQPDLILLSVVEDTFKLAATILEFLKPRNIPSMMGGVFPTAAPKKCLDWSLVDAVCVGEGESVVKAALQNFKAGVKNFEHLPRVWVRDNDGKPVEPVSKKSDALENIGRVKPNFRLFDLARFNRPMGGRVFRTLPLETYRGCPFQCTFCNSPMQLAKSSELGLGHFLRRKKIKEVQNIISQLVEDYGAEYLYFVDDSFLSRPKAEISDFIDMYSEFKIPFWFNTRPESCTPEILDSLLEVGLDRLSVGLEHGNEEFRKTVLLRKPSNEKLLKHLGYIAESGVSFSVNTMIGFPGETRDMIFDTIDFCRQINSFDAMTVSIFTPYHGTVLRKVAVEKGFLDDCTLTKHTTSSSLLKMPDLSVDEIDGLFRTFMMYVRFDKDRYNEIFEAESLTTEGDAIWQKLYIEYQERYFDVDQDGAKYKTKNESPSAVLSADGSVNFYSGDWEEVFGENSKSYSR